MNYLPIFMLFLFLLIMVSGIPIAIAMILVSVILVLIQGGGMSALVIPFARLPIGFSFALLSVFLFIQLGILINGSKMGDHILNFLRIIFRKIKGRTAVIMILTCAAFGPMTGSAVGTATAVGAALCPQMKKSGYDTNYSGTLLGFSSLLGTLIPPSISGLIYAVVVELPILGVWMATLGPALIYLVALLLVNFNITNKRKYESSLVFNKNISINEATKSFLTALPALFIPITIIGSIYGGIATATEAGSLGLLAAILIVILFNRIYSNSLSLKFFTKIIYEAAYQTAIIMFLICASFALSYVLTSTGMIKSIANIIIRTSNNKYVIVLLVEALVIVLGCFLDDTPIMILLAPLASLILIPMGFHPYHLAGIFVFTCVVGLVTPPVGTVLYAAAAISKMNVTDSLKEILIFFIPAMVVLLIVTFFPGICLFFPKLLNLM